MNQDLKTEFKNELEKLYGEKCLISGEDCGYEACHIVPYSECNNFELSNGLLLRVDLHRHYDNYNLTINPYTLCVEVCNDMLQKSLVQFNGKIVNICEDFEDAIKANLNKMYDRYCVKHNLKNF